MRFNHFKWGLGILALGTAAALVDALFLEKYFFKLKQFRIGKKDTSKHLKILFLTDLHFVAQLLPFHKRLARKINAINPDVLLLTGDIIDYSGTLAPAKQFFSLLNKAIPKVAIAGNHDHKNNVHIGSLKKVLVQNNGRLLINETERLLINGETLTITGVDDFIEGNANFTDAIQGVGKEAHHFLLIHSPLQQEIIQREIQEINTGKGNTDPINVQYILAGHNHGGQVRIGTFAPVLPEQSGSYLNGWYNTHKPYLYVSKGFGTSGIPFRFGARSEIILFHYGI